MALITRQRIMFRARYKWPQKSVTFSKTDFHPSGYLCSAPGYVSMCWGIPKHAPRFYGGMSTLAMDSDGWAYEIDPKDMKPGDALGLIGPGSVGTDGGNIVIFEGWLNDDYMSNYAICWEMLPDASPGPVRRARPYDGSRWHSYRYKDVVETELPEGVLKQPRA